MVSDFGLVEAIESGIVKIPRVPVDDNAATPNVQFLNLWPSIKDGLPKKGRKEGTVTPDQIPGLLEGALNALYDSYAKAFAAWETARREEVRRACPRLHRRLQQHHRLQDGLRLHRRLGEASCRRLTRPSGCPASWRCSPTSTMASRSPGRARSSSTPSSSSPARGCPPSSRRSPPPRSRSSAPSTPAASPAAMPKTSTTAQIMREVMNTVGKAGKLGEPVRCVVSVSMLTEGWDANTVTHILGVRAFGTQLLCEQVVGRGLRRRSYEPDENGFFTPEYADVYGVPFQFMPDGRQGQGPHHEADALRPRPAREERGRDQLPAAGGLPAGDSRDPELFEEFTERSRLTLDTEDIPTEDRGERPDRQSRGAHARRAAGQARPGGRLRPRAPDHDLVRRTAGTRALVLPAGAADHQAVDGRVRHLPRRHVPRPAAAAENADEAARRILHESHHLSRSGNKHRAGRAAVPARRPDWDRPPTWTSSPPRRSSRPARSATSTSSSSTGSAANLWEKSVAEILETLPPVAAYVKNDRLGFTVPYAMQGRSHEYIPDFLVRLKPREDDDPVRTLIVEVSGTLKNRRATTEKADTTRDLWLPAINGHGGFGRWGYCELTDPATFRRGPGTAIDGAVRRDRSDVRP